MSEQLPRREIEYVLCVSLQFVDVQLSVPEKKLQNQRIYMAKPKQTQNVIEAGGGEDKRTDRKEAKRREWSRRKVVVFGQPS